MTTSYRYSIEEAYQLVRKDLDQGAVPDGVHVLERTGLMDSTKNLVDMGAGMMGFDGGGGRAVWDVTGKMNHAVPYWILVQFTADNSRPLNVWVQDDNGDTFVMAENFADAVTNAWDSAGLQWFNHGPYKLPRGSRQIKIDAVQQGFWPHVRKFVLIPADVDAPNPHITQTNGSLPNLSSSPCIKIPSHPAVKAKLEAIPFRKGSLQQSPPPLAILRTPEEKSSNVQVNPGMIMVGGSSGWYTFAFDNPPIQQVYLDVTFASGDSRPVTLTIDGKHSHPGCCADTTGGFNHEHFVHRRYGPVILQPSVRNKILVTTNNGCFPHIGEIRVVDASNAGAQVTPLATKTWIVPPSQDPSPPIRSSLDFCFEENTQESNPMFRPDPTFYNGICVDGLWVLTSKQVDIGILNCAAELVSRYVPVEIRRLFLQWRAPHNMPQGPFRLIILDAASNQQAGDCPEFPDSWRGRNSTINPGVFSSSDDFRRAEHGRFCGGELLVHELTHGLDLVIRQQLDPYFMQEVEDCFQRARMVFQKSYAAANRHEYLAEICMLFVGTNPSNFTRGCCQCEASDTGYCTFEHHKQFGPGPQGVNFRRKSDLIENDPGGYQLLKSFLIEIRDDDKFWWD
jgi:hypothetical protein